MNVPGSGLRQGLWLIIAFPTLLAAGCGDDTASTIFHIQRFPVGALSTADVVDGDVSRGDSDGGDGRDATVPDTVPGGGDAVVDLGDASDGMDGNFGDTGAGGDAPVGPDGPLFPEPARYPADRVLSPVSAWHVAYWQEIAARDPTLAPDVFMKVGASTTVSSHFLKCFSGDAVDLDGRNELQSTLDHFLGGNADGTDPFTRASLAARSGMSARWAITGDPSPLDAEYGAVLPRFAFVHFGTNDMGLGTTWLSALWPFADNLWTLVDTLLARGVIPVLATIQRRLDKADADLWVPTYNGVIAAIAEGRQIPLVDMHLANETLPNHGLASDGLHSSVYSAGACRFTSEGLRFGMNHRNLQMLTMLSRLEAAVLDGEAHDADTVDVKGLGTPDEPYVIDGLPFQDLRDTRSSTSQTWDMYPACGSNANEAGPEVVYRLELNERTRLRATVHGQGATDVDIHLLDETGVPEGCMARHHQVIEATLDPGTWHFALDSFVSSDGSVRSGEFLLSIVACPENDATCGGP